MVHERRVVGGGCQQQAGNCWNLEKYFSSGFTIRAYLLAQLEDGEGESSDEGEERQLQSIPGFKSEHSQSERDQSHGFQENEDEEGNEKFLQL